MLFKDIEHEIVVSYNIEKVYDAVLQAVDSLSKFSVKSENRVAHVINISVGVSMFSWGESMSVTLKDLSDSQTEIRFTSGSKLGTEIAAGSKNKKNIETLMNAMTSFLA